MQHKPEDFLPFAEQLATLSGEIVRRYYRKEIPFDVKADSSPVTLADREIENNIRAMIRSTHPSHGIIGEEYEPHNPDSEFVWMIDPIDGTKSFMVGRPIFGTLISLLHYNEPVIGIIDQPILGERWTGVKGYATTLNYEPIRTRTCPDLAHAVLCTTSPCLFPQPDLPAFQKLRDGAQYTVYGGDCYSYGLLARGSVDVIIESGLKPYDFCALKPIVEGAGGMFTDWQGQSISLHSDGRVLATGDKSLHNTLLASISGQN